MTIKNCFHSSYMFLNRILQRERAKRLTLQADLLKTHLSYSFSLVDVGCGSGYLLTSLNKSEGSFAMGLDVDNYLADKNNPISLFDGNTFPLANVSVDYIVFSFCLHHTKNKSRLLKEAIRIGKKCIFVFEDMPSSFLQKIISYIHGLGFKLAYSLSDDFEFFSLKRWKNIFEELDMGNNIEIHELPNSLRQWYYPVNRKLIVIRIDH